MIKNADSTYSYETLHKDKLTRGEEQLKALAEANTKIAERAEILSQSNVKACDGCVTILI